ncbi:MULTISPECIES: hypothetical protein [Pandoraea]|uniref:hypothetical protein n=1 Tax=Pandoraea TaxID=93217 RepID=UPI001112CDD8|nr:MULTISPECIES: hypothetical protein [Pandoraea]
MEELPGGPGDEADGRYGARNTFSRSPGSAGPPEKFRLGADHFGLAVHTKRNWTRNFISVFSGRLPTLILLVTAPHFDFLRERYSQSDQLGQCRPG